MDKIIGYEACPDCHGTGIVKRGECERCKGLGRIRVYDDDDDDSPVRY